METGPAPFRQGKTEQEARLSKTCMYCGQQRPMSEFRRRTGKRAGPGARRGACRSCRQLGGQADHESGSSVGRTNERMERQRDGLDTHAVPASPSASARNEAGRTSHGIEQGSATLAESDRSLVSQPSVESSSSNDDERADLVTSSPSSSGIRKKRRRRRKSKRSESITGNELRETSLKQDGSAGEVGDDPQPGERWRGEEGHSQGHAAANEKALHSGLAREQPLLCRPPSKLRRPTKLCCRLSRKARQQSPWLRINRPQPNASASGAASVLPRSRPAQGRPAA